MSNLLDPAIQAKQEDAKQLSERIMAMTDQVPPERAMAALKSSFIDSAQVMVLMDMATSMLRDASPLNIDGHLKEQLLYVLEYGARREMEPADDGRE